MFLQVFVWLWFISLWQHVFDPSHPKISMHILHTVLYTRPKVLTKRICLTINSFFNWWSFLPFSWPQHLIQWWYCKEKLDTSHYYGSKSYKTSVRDFNWLEFPNTDLLLGLFHVLVTWSFPSNSASFLKIDFSQWLSTSSATNSMKCLNITKYTNLWLMSKTLWNNLLHDSVQVFGQSWSISQSISSTNHSSKGNIFMISGKLNNYLKRLGKREKNNVIYK